MKLIRWANPLPDDADVAIDDGGLTIVCLCDDPTCKAYCEVGGIPLDDEDDESCERQDDE